MAKKEYIDRRSLGIKCANPSAFINPAYAMGWNSAVKLIQNAPVADVAPVVHGEWIFINPPTEIIDWEECSVCGYANYNFSHYKYCPSCGTKMDGKESNV